MARQTARARQRVLPHAEGPVNFDRASHFLQDDRGPDIVQAIIPFLDRVVRHV